MDRSSPRGEYARQQTRSNEWSVSFAEASDDPQNGPVWRSRPRPPWPCRKRRCERREGMSSVSKIGVCEIWLWSDEAVTMSDDRTEPGGIGNPITGAGAGGSAAAGVVSRETLPLAMEEPIAGGSALAVVVGSMLLLGRT